MKNQFSDEELIRQFLQTRTGPCFETLYKRYAQKVFSRCLSITKDTEKAQDYTHDIFIRMFARIGQYNERSSFATWLYSITFNYCMDQVRAYKRLPMIALDEQTDYAYAISDDADLTECNLQQLSHVMGVMPTQEAALLRLKYQDGLNIRQIADQLNLNDSAVKMRLKRSRDRAKRLYNVAVC